MARDHTPLSLHLIGKNFIYFDLFKRDLEIRKLLVFFSDFNYLKAHPRTFARFFKPRPKGPSSLRSNVVSLRLAKHIFRS